MSRYKTCCNKECKQPNPQPITAFNRDSHKKDGLRSRCRECIKDYKKQLYLTDPSKQYMYNLKYITMYPEKRAETQRNYRYKAKHESN